MPIMFSLSVLFSLILVIFTHDSFAETEELTYFDIERNNELTKQEISDVFWKNPFDTPPMIFLIALMPVIIIIAWKRKWYKHEKKTDLQ